MQACKHVAKNLGIYNDIITMDEALFCMLMELKCAKAEYQDGLIGSLDGFHNAMKSLQIIGQ